MYFSSKTQVSPLLVDFRTHVYAFDAVSQVHERLSIDQIEKIVTEGDRFEMFQGRELIWIQGRHLIVTEVQGLESVVAVEGLGDDVADVVLAEVQLHHDAEVAEGVHVDFLEEHGFCKWHFLAQGCQSARYKYQKMTRVFAPNMADECKISCNGRLIFLIRR